MIESIAPFIVPLAPLLVAPVLAVSAAGTWILLAPAYLVFALAAPPGPAVPAAPAVQMAGASTGHARPGVPR